MMKVRYVRSERGRTAIFNEDAWGKNANCVWVLDGATDLSRTIIDGVSSARWFVDHISAALKSMAAPDHFDALIGTLSTATSASKKSFCAAMGAPNSNTLTPPSATLLIALDLGDWVELGALGDSRILYEENGETKTLGESKVEQLDEAVIAKAAAIRAKTPSLSLQEIRNLIAPTLNANRAKMNQPNGYPMLSFNPCALNKIQRIKIKKSSLSNPNLLLATDGYLRLVELFKLRTYASLLAHSSIELDQAFDLLRQTEQEDPEGNKFLRLKPEDDATCVRVSIS